MKDMAAFLGLECVLRITMPYTPSRNEQGMSNGVDRADLPAASPAAIASLLYLVDGRAVEPPSFRTSRQAEREDRMHAMRLAEVAKKFAERGNEEVRRRVCDRA